MWGSPTAVYSSHVSNQPGYLKSTHCLLWVDCQQEIPEAEAGVLASKDAFIHYSTPLVGKLLLLTENSTQLISGSRPLYRR